MDQVYTIIAELVKKKGKSKSEVAEKLGISSQLLGQYTNGRQKPKADFYIKWKNTFGEDILMIVEAKSSGGDGQKIAIDYDYQSMAKDLLQLKALVKMLKNRNAELEAKIYSRDLDEVLDEQDNDTRIILRDLIK